jgi:hypothetical protein
MRMTSLRGVLNGDWGGGGQKKSPVGVVGITKCYLQNSLLAS